MNNGDSKILPLTQWNEYSKTNSDWTIQVQYKIPENKKIEKGLIHAAYLTCFEYFGYEFIFSKSGQLMRDVLNDKTRYPANILDLNQDSVYTIQNIPQGLVFINEPHELQTMAVNLKLKLKETGYTTIKTILIPNPTTNGIEDLKIVSDRFINYLGGLSMLPLKNFLQLNELPPYRKMWGTLLRDYIK